MFELLCNVLLAFGILVFTLCSLFYFFLKTQYVFWRNLRISGPEPQMLFGNSEPLVRMEMNEAELADKFYKEYSNEKYVGYYNMWRPFLLIRDVELLEKMMDADGYHFNERPGLKVNFVSDSLMINMFALKDEIWKSRRAVFSKVFRPKRIKEYFHDMQTSLSYLMEDFEAEVNEDMHLDEIMNRYTIRKICKDLYGLDLGEDNDRVDKIAECLEVFVRSPPSVFLKMKFCRTVPFLFKILGIRVFPECVYEYFSKFLKEMISSRRSGKVVRNDLLDVVIKMMDGVELHSERISFEEALGHIYTFLLMGADPTELCLCHVFLQLATNPEIQEKARKEVDSVLKGAETITYEHLSEMSYLNAIVCETLRLFPPLGTMTRVCSKPYKVDDNFTIPKGMPVLMPFFSIQRDPAHYPDPEKFDPERFYNNSGENKNTWVPFGIGPRVCIGVDFAMLSIKLALAKTLSHYVIQLSKKMRLPMKFEPNTILFATLPIDGFWIKLQRRSSRSTK